MKSMNAYESIFEYVSGLPVVDTHEHLPDRGAGREKPTDVLKEYLTHYFDKDLISAGMPPATLEFARDIGKPLMDRWKAVEPYWSLASNTGYARALDIAARDLHRVDGISSGTIEELDASFQRSLEDPLWFRHVLKDRCNIVVSILDRWMDYATAPRWEDLFAPVWRIDGLVLMPGFGSEAARLEARLGLKIRSFGDYLEAIDADIGMSARLGYCGFKLGVAYQRSLNFERSGFAEAELEFNALVSSSYEPIWQRQSASAPKALQDYCLHRALRAVERTGLPLQVHTGLQEGNGNRWANSDPLLLNNLFSQYPGLRFDLFHIGYPNWTALSALAKNYTNVYIDLCWANIVSPEACVNAVMEYLDSVPSNKISAFGGDYLMIDPVYGHLKLARQNISRALSLKVERGAFDVDAAKVYARRMFLENPAALYGVKIG